MQSYASIDRVVPFEATADRVPWWPGLVVGGVLLVAAACGGAPTTYDGEAFAGCLRDLGGAETILARDTLRGGNEPDAAVLLNSRLPGAMAASLDTGERLLFFAARDTRAASDGAHWMQELTEKYPAADGSAITTYGNLVVATRPHPSERLTQLVGRCRTEAANP